METGRLLHELAERYETANFLRDDPAQFMHCFAGRGDAEVAAFVAAALSYGQRTAFLPVVQMLLDKTEGEPERWVRSRAFVDVIDDNEQTFYRLTTNHALRGMLAGLQAMLQQYGSIGDFVRNNAGDGFSAVEALARYFGTYGISPLIPRDAQSACKRLCMFLRWMVRSGSPVDLGLWSHFIDRRTLIMPLDTHVLTMACRLNLTATRNASMPAAKKLTTRMLRYFPDDPLRGDFALFGLGISLRPNKKGTSHLL